MANKLWVLPKISFLKSSNVSLGKFLTFERRLSHFKSGVLCQCDILVKSVYGTKININNYCTKNANAFEDVASKNTLEDGDSENLFSNNEDLIKELAEGDLNRERQLKILAFEIDILREQGVKVPSKLRPSDWEELLTLPDVTKRKRFLLFLFKNEMKHLNELKKKAKNLENRIKAYNEMVNEGHMIYSLNENSILLRMYEKSMALHLNDRLMGALLHSQHVIFDCSYQNFMQKLSSRAASKQLALSYSANRTHPAPFHVKLCNVNKEDLLYQDFAKLINLSENSYFTWDIHEESYLDLYPKDKLVYLTPHTNNVLHQYSHDDVYIIGAYVDKSNGIKASLAKAKENKLRTAKFPLDYYLDWQKGGKSLTLNSCFNILLNMRLYNNWNKAFKHVPRRFLTPKTSKKKDNLNWN